MYVPGDRPDRVEKAFASRAHAVIVDLEDGVPADAKDAARANVAELLSAPRDKPAYVRVNAHEPAEIELVAALPLAGVLVPKVESPDDVPDVPVHALIETARGIEAAFEIAAHPNVRGLSLGEADLRSQVGATDLDWWRARVVNAA
ncbi:MAG TPA: aldolase/citrate lyase family protein, partial [Gaiellaceae bacterium]